MERSDTRRLPPAYRGTMRDILARLDASAGPDGMSPPASGFTASRETSPGSGP